MTARILIVEDDERLASVLEKGLSEAGFLTTRAPDAESALRHVNLEQVDLVITDIMLPKLKKFSRRFIAEKNHARAEGSGIGLALTKRIVELHRGAIAVRSQLGKGTTFALEFPNQIAQSE